MWAWNPSSTVTGTNTGWYLARVLLINRGDAAARGIGDGDLFRVFSDRGEVSIPARVTERIMPGVVDMPQGAWYRPDERGADRGGNPNVVSRDQSSPGGAFPYNTGLVQVGKSSGIAIDKVF